MNVEDGLWFLVGFICGSLITNITIYVIMRLKGD